ncbi:hypothetical protein A1O1_00410 [Capronia coronata CBS 617.96]|uniref:Uncharacterized protein n=1 Tax=Capronia coronata CBS 617.96 TaxID=1182541 RepID=W9Z010_9EURO|nr:uncharacterized protein A1O1_00410 [Capronia coronata CBS 617.96]EXJ95290.1 hypothetical protein A1O1_00410 [Capronia coronata CBS 617.96]
MNDSNDSDDATGIAAYLASLLEERLSVIESVYLQSPRNIQIILRRQLGRNLGKKEEGGHQPVCRIQGEQALLEALRLLPFADALFTLARIYDAGHIALCKDYGSAKKGKPHNVHFVRDPCIDVSRLTEGILQDQQKRHDEIRLVTGDGLPNVLEATWIPVATMNFDHLPTLESLSEILPGEVSPGKEYAGIGGGGGSDIISASLVGHLLRRNGKEMDLLVSTRTWRTGSQGKAGSKIGVKREVQHHGGPAMLAGNAIAGTYHITPETSTEGRDLETVPIQHHNNIYIVLDQGEEPDGIPEDEKADLPQQFRAVLSQCSKLDTVIVVDTGGDVFGGDFVGFSTPDQDVRVQRAVAQLRNTYPNLVTAVLAPGVDAPADAPEKAKLAGGKIYKLTAEERDLLLDILSGEYRMDGSDPDRFGKTNLCLQAALKGERGWTCLDLPTHVLDTWDNPWSCFAYVRECMCDLILMPLQDLLPLIDPGAV